MIQFSTSRWLLAPLLFLFLGSTAHGQLLPADFSLTASAGGLSPWSEVTTITVDNLGQGTSARYKAGGVSAAVVESTFTLSAQNVQQLWQAIQAANFSSIASPPPDTTVHGGSFAKLQVTANGATHQVILRNVAQDQVQAILTSLNAVLPPSIQLQYTPPTKWDIVPRDPCTPDSGSVQSEDGGGTSSTTLNPKADRRPAKAALRATPAAVYTVAAHPGTVVSYTLPLEQAIRNRLVTLRSKGEFFGDDVSISVDNRVPHPKDEVDVTLYLEFWGPLATRQRITGIVSDIQSKWNGHTTTSGQKFVVNVVTKSNTSATKPPGTAGFHEIHIVPSGSERSNVSGTFGLNMGTGAGAWETNQESGTYAHEAGHLMGLPDRYVDYQKQPNGSWVNSDDNTSFPNTDQFADYLKSRDPASSLALIKSNLGRMDLVSIPLVGSEHDLMADVSQPVRQSDIDLIASSSGLMVHVPPGTVLVDHNGDNQNLVITHAEDVFAGPGERRTLNGLYGACIDHYRGIPDSIALFDVAPPLAQWGGFPAAGYLDRVVRYIDSAGLYCGSIFSAQEAIWRITDNSQSLFTTSAPAILASAGVDLTDQVLDFPHLSPRSIGDTNTAPFVPNELFAADIQPRFAGGKPGTPSLFSGSVATPAGTAFAPAFTWTAMGTDSTVYPITSSGATASITPTKTGIFAVGLNISVTDSAFGQRSFSSARKAYLVVPDSTTETFEQGKLPDYFPWKNRGTVAWTVTSTNPQTGSFAAQPGDLASGGSALLAIELAMAQPGNLTFAIRTATGAAVEGCQFLIDSLTGDFYSGIHDWLFAQYRLSAGTHTLEWRVDGGTATAGKIWLDNIFFPAHSVVTSIGSEEGLPTTFRVFQNYPNPFNPTTTIRFALPHRTHVVLAVYNTLGQQVARLVDGDLDAGYHNVRFDGKDLASGIYFYRLQAGSYVQVHAMALVR